MESSTEKHLIRHVTCTYRISRSNRTSRTKYIAPGVARSSLAEDYNVEMQVPKFKGCSRPREFRAAETETKCHWLAQTESRGTSVDYFGATGGFRAQTGDPPPSHRTGLRSA